MINIFNKILKFTLIFSAVITGWTSIILLSNTIYNSEIKDLINKIYNNQKNFILNVKDLSILLVKDADFRFSEYQDFSKYNNIDNSFKE